MSTSESDSDSDHGVEKYRQIGARDPRRRERVPNAEDIAFASWVANQKHEKPWNSNESHADARSSALTEPDVPDKTKPIINSPRQYQLDLFERAKESNTIVVLDTGSGKTLIAALLLRHTLDGELQRRADGLPQKAAFFLVDKVVLCIQQYNVLSANLSCPVGKAYGKTVSRLKTKEDWDGQIRENMTIVCTAQILLDLLGSGLVSMQQINLLIFDEAHHTKKSHPYARIVRDHYLRMETERPRILGMTASPLDSKMKDLKVAALELEATLCSKIATISDEALARESQKRQQLERVSYYAPISQPEQAKTDLWRSLYATLGLMTEFSSHLEATHEISCVLGPWCADQYWNILFSPSKVSQKPTVMYQLERLDQFDEGSLELEVNHQIPHGLEAEHMVTAVTKAIRITMDYMQQRQSANADATCFSSKLLALHEILSEAFSEKQTRRCIVFVQKRYIAFMLSDVFNQPGVRVEKMRCGYVVGSQSVSSSIANMSVREQLQTLFKFQTGEINCLFATQVAEEGIDVPDCDLIIRFDLHESAIQYIQSRGRARQAKSTYINMVEENNLKQKRQLMEASRDAIALRRFISILSADRKVADVAQSVDAELQEISQRVVHIPGTGAQLTYDSSVQVLAKFVSSLSNSIDDHPEYVVTPTYAGGRFIATVILPDSSPVKVFRGMPQRSKILARGSAALVACIDMIKRRFINEHLQPTLSKRLPAMRNARLALSSNKRVEYNLKIRSDDWSTTGIPTELFAVIIAIDGAVLLGKNGRCLCLLTRFRLPQLPPMDLFVDQVKKTSAALIQCGTSLRVSEHEVAILASFTLTMFKDVFSKEYDCTVDALPYFMAPCVPMDDPTSSEVDARTVIDWTLLDAVHVPETDSVLASNDHAGDFQNKFVVDAWDGSRKFFTKQVNSTLTPSDPVPASAPKPKSRSYFRGEQNIAEYSTSLTIQARRRAKWNLEQPLPVDVVITALALPVIMYRIDSMMVSIDACRFLDLKIDASLALEAFTKDNSQTEAQDEQNIDFQPGMGNNYERLEYLGDTFLKMATTIALFTKIPNTSEFEYHVERMLLVCNQNLFNNAVDRNLEIYIRCKGFDRRTWYPDLKLKKGKPTKATSRQNLANKSIADVCEAVIGAAYMSEPRGKMDLAVKAVTKMVRSKNHTMTQFSDYYNEYEVPPWQSAAPSAAETFAAEKTHARIGYKFNSPKLLRSAFKHPSYPYEPAIPHYQCLEFLGDALLDLAAADYLFTTFPTADPQWLTEHKMAMVSNHFFACLCVDLGLHRNLLSTNSSMLGHIAQFVSQFERAKTDALTNRHDDEPNPAFWLNLTQPPKSLSDVLEAVVGAIFVDSKYNFQAVQDFFDKCILPYFRDMSRYDMYAAGNAVTVLTKLMQDVFTCRSWRLCVATVPSSSETGAAALTEENVVCAMMVHGRVVESQIRANGREAKVGVATNILQQVQNMDKETFRTMMGCDCA
ncbi:hypothetical protein E4U17_000089 [Claviceps sp. LM77 group G4]|nr:hypothetical protein E4U17_000089 [Claviceps sp. LM77 group G4]KAG6053951.1 hypothetical protein E4U33_008216 [Claviceps sp. LM78 group G4]KAG6069038.1 hypothetical protein E4U16_007805 [Claviceps sp. LM84 group G4]